MLYKEAIAKVASFYFVGELGVAIDVWFTCRRLHYEGAVFLARNTRIIEWIDVDSDALGMFRQPLAARNLAIAVTRRVVGLHRTLVIVAILRDGTYVFNGILGPIEFGKDVTQVISDSLVANDCALVCHPIAINVLHRQRVEQYARRLSSQRKKGPKAPKDSNYCSFHAAKIRISFEF